MQNVAMAGRRVAGVAAAAMMIAAVVGMSVGTANAAGSVTIPLHSAHRGTDSAIGFGGVSCSGGPVTWNFVVNQLASGTPAGSLTAMFQQAGSKIFDASQVEQQTQHFAVTTPSNDVLEDADATVAAPQSSPNLVLSHITCSPAPSSSPDVTPSAQQAGQGPSKSADTGKEATGTDAGSTKAAGMSSGASVSAMSTSTSGAVSAAGVPSNLPDGAVSAAGVSAAVEGGATSAAGLASSGSVVVTPEGAAPPSAVAGAATALPQTGSNDLPQKAGVAVILILAGCLTLLSVRRRRAVSARLL